MSRGLPAVLAVALLASACGRSAALPRTVPEGGGLAEGQRRSYLRTLAEIASGDPVGAERALAPLLALRPLHVPSHLLHQDLSRAAGRGEAIAAEYLTLSRSLPGDASADVLVTRAVHGLPADRVAGYQAAAVKDPAAPWPRIALATERAEYARELLRRADAKTRAGFAEEGEKLRSEARTSLSRARTEGERAVAVAPDLAAAHGSLGHVLALTAALLPMDDKERNDLRGRAIERMSMALRIDPGDPRILAGRALLLQETGRGGEAQQDFDAAAAAAPKDPSILAARARNLEALQLPERAIEAWTEVAAAAPGNPEVLVDLGSALARAGRWKEALLKYRASDALFAAKGGERWKARQGLVTALVQMSLVSRQQDLVAEALAHLKSYGEEGGPDNVWAGKMATILGQGAAGPGTGGTPVPPADAGR